SRRGFAHAVGGRGWKGWAKAHDDPCVTTLLCAMRLCPPYAPRRPSDIMPAQPGREGPRMAGRSAGKMKSCVARGLWIGIVASAFAAEVDAFLAGTTKSCIGCDLSGRDLKGLEFKRTKLDRAILKDADLREATLFRSTLQRADLSGAKLVDADLNRIDAK